MSTLVAMDPSFTATGLVAVDLASARIIAVGLVRTKPPGASERLTAAEANARRGLTIRRSVRDFLRLHQPAIVVQEGNAGSKSALAAAALARAQQACVDAVDEALVGVMPIIVTPQSVKKWAVNRLDASKDDLERAALERWGESLRTAIAASKLRGNVLENVYDAACVAASVWDLPAVGGLRAMARAHGGAA